MTRPDNGLPEDIREHMRLMCDIVALGFQTDKTRIATLLLCRDISGLFYPFLDVELAHHPASHDDRSDAFDAHLPVTTSASSPTSPSGSTPCPKARAPCSTIPASCSCRTCGPAASTTTASCPCSPAGGLGGTLETGRVLDYTEAGDDNRKLCSLYLSIMDRMGVKLDRFGDATERLTGI